MNFEIDENEFVVIMGELGLGKFILFNLIVIFDCIIEGLIKLDGLLFN